MSLRKIIISLLGKRKFLQLRAWCLWVRDIFFRYNKYPVKIYGLKILIHEKYRHLFCGYYDANVFDATNERLLYHSTEKRAMVGIDCASIYYYEINTKRKVFCCKTKAWSWQMGSRLRWSLIRVSCFFYNDYDEGTQRYVTRKFDILSKKIVESFPYAFYDIDSAETYGLSLDFNRLQRLRPGYGYSNMLDSTAQIKCPIDNGIWRYDFLSHSCKLIIRISELCFDFPNYGEYEHYINHISISPDGSKFIFFHIANLNNKWRARLFVCDKDGTNLKLLESVDNVSHYAWRNCDEILITLFNDRKAYYALINLITCKKNILDESLLVADGHPSFVNENEFVSDTYPNKANRQSIYIYKNIEICEIGQFYHTPLLYGEKRCDLHPKISFPFVAVDTAALQNVRSLVITKINDEV